ncbi:DUF2382 domain-containing protein [Kineococcus sp. LSe6-4]|uniref:DUF2382 domain-containing protein n=1 Tax=Kineococcus halophytocola TaxID=3234027 RepID=A0ABV4H378_9ACTN
MVLSAEALRTRTVRVAHERVRISKRIVETTRTVEVPVRVEQLVLTHEPLEPLEPLEPGETGPGTVPAGPAGEIVLVLHEEVPQVSLRVEPVEVVRIGVVTRTGEAVVETTVRTEQAEVDELPSPGT